VREELIRENRPLVQQLVNHVLAAGQWLDQSPANRTKAVEIAARPQFFNQDVNVLKYVMENPSDRVTYGDLRMLKPEFDEMMKLSIAAGTIKQHIPFEKYVDESFFKNASATRVTFAT
jgi:NitT/TauT family transport system substrate-binding protein